MLKAQLRKRYQHWVRNRFQIEHKTTLGHKTVLIFLHRSGFLYFILIFITFVAGVNYGNNLILGFCFLISSVLCISFYLTFRQLYGLELEIIYPDVGRVGQPYTIDIIFKQKNLYYRYIYIENQTELQKILLTEQQQKMSLNYFPQQRGLYQPNEIKLYAIYPFGLVRTWTYLFLQCEIWVAPKAEHIARENKVQKADFTPDVDEFRELRPFKQGDSYQAVSWKQSALGQGLFVKVFEQMKEQQQIHIAYDDMPSTSHEEKLSLMMGLVDMCHQQNIAYSMQLPRHNLSYQSGYEQFVNAQKLLAQA